MEKQKLRIENLIFNKLKQYKFEVPEEEYGTLARNLAEDIVNMITEEENSVKENIKRIINQKDCPAEFIEIVNKEFWDLI